MNNKVRKLELKKIIQEYNFLLTDEKYKQEVISENKSKFLKEIHDRKVELGLIEDKPYKPEEESQEKKEPKENSNTENNEQDLESNKESGVENGVENDKEECYTQENVSFEKKEKSKKAKSIYREIVKHTHPDKAGNDDLIELYNRATDAYNKNQIIELYFISIELDIDVELSDEDFENIKETINLKRRELHNLEMSFLWLWYNAKSKEQREKVVALFINKTNNN